MPSPEQKPAQPASKDQDPRRVTTDQLRLETNRSLAVASLDPVIRETFQLDRVRAEPDQQSTRVDAVSGLGSLSFDPSYQRVQERCEIPRALACAQFGTGEIVVVTFDEYQRVFRTEDKTGESPLRAAIVSTLPEIGPLRDRDESRTAAEYRSVIRHEIPHALRFSSEYRAITEEYRSLETAGIIPPVSRELRLSQILLDYDAETMGNSTVEAFGLDRQHLKAWGPGGTAAGQRIDRVLAVIAKDPSAYIDPASSQMLADLRAYREGSPEAKAAFRLGALDTVLVDSVAEYGERQKMGTSELQRLTRDVYTFIEDGRESVPAERRPQTARAVRFAQERIRSAETVIDQALR
ncbi:MAG: hypothetical protein IT290_10735 [Deltaproteobacteria bacterium]|nr:hypothetical protein [Deltaproteobacteria bacterium]